MAETVVEPASADPLDTLATCLRRTRAKSALVLVSLHNRDRLGRQHDGLDDDEVTVKFQSTAESILRSGDSMVALSEDRVALILDDLIDIHHLELAGMKLARLFERPVRLGERSVNLDVYSGILYMARRAETDMESQALLLRAQNALDKAQHQGAEGPYVIVTLDDEDHVENHWQIGMRLREAMQSHHIYLDYQPRIHLDTGELDSAQALVRWRDHGVVLPPADYLTALNADQLWELTVYTVRRLIRDIQDHEISVPVALSLDSSALTEPDLVAFLQRETSLWGIEARQIILEFSACALCGDDTRVTDTLMALHQRGFRLSANDLQDNLSALPSMTASVLHEVKLGRSLIMTPNSGEPVGEPVDDTATSADPALEVLNWAVEKGLICVAQGIEDAQTLETLRAAGCQLGQGFYLSAPLSVEKLQALT